MKKKIIGIFIFTLLIASFVLTATGTVNNVKNTLDEQKKFTEKIVSPANNDDIDWWPTFQHDNNRSGYSTSSGPNTNNILWASGVGNTIWGNPVIVDNKIYFGDDGSNSFFYCFNADTGEEIWKTPIYSGTRGMPTIEDGRVYIGLINGIFYCLDANDGSIIWQHQNGNIMSSSLVSDGKVYLCPFDDEKMYCLNAETGQEIWSSEISRCLESPALFNGNIYTSSAFYTGENNVYCINASNGNIIWTFMKYSGKFRSPLIDDEKIYVGNREGFFYCLDANDGSLIWEYETNGHISTSSCLGDGKIYFADIHFYLYCLNAITGEEIWELKMPTGHEIFASPIYVDDMIYFASCSGFVHCFNADTGEEIWNYETVNTMRASPAVANGNLYICTMEGWIFCFGGESNNNPPNKPLTPEGPTSLVVNKVYRYNSSTFDIDGDQIYYRWKWAEGDTGWLGPYNSNETTTADVIFYQVTGDSEIEVIARDSNYATSEWASLAVTVQKNRAYINRPFFNFLENHPILFQILQRFLNL